MDERTQAGAPERKFHRPEAGITVTEGSRVEGYASVFGRRDQGGDVVARGAYAASLAALAASGRRVKMLWQHDPAQPIGVWDEVREDATGLYVKGRILTDVARGQEAVALLAAGAIDGLSIGYRTLRAERDAKGQRLLQELDLWEVSLVTFPMLAEARVQAKADPAADAGWSGLARLFEQARRNLAAR
jgi:HK97 family phage prohead protease